MQSLNNLINMARSNAVYRLLPAGFRKTMKRILLASHVYNETASRLGLNTIYEDDTFVCSYPKSGNTWIRFLLAHMLQTKEQITFKNIDNYVADIHKPNNMANNMRRPRFIKTHHPFFQHFPRFIYIYRDGRDALVSYYHYECQNGRFQGSFSQFLRSNAHSMYGGWAEHVTQALVVAAKHPQQALVLQYEKMLEFPFDYARSIAAFCNLSPNAELIKAAVMASSFNQLKDMETQYGSEIEGKAVNFFRNGSAGGWESVFSKEDLAFFNERMGETLITLGYK